MRIDWSKAPEGATHYDAKARFDPWMKKVDSWFVHDGKMWKPYVLARGDELDLIPRPTKPSAPEWDGDGKPPVNVKCEMADENGIFREVLTFAVFNAYVFGWDYERGVPYYSDDDREFRPIRTKEQRERDELLKIMAEHATLSRVAIADAKEIANAILEKYELKEKDQ